MDTLRISVGVWKRLGNKEQLNLLNAFEHVEWENAFGFSNEPYIYMEFKYPRGDD